MKHITKIFPGIVANDDITFELRHGEVHSLLGENGAGKSTLMSVLFGIYKPEQGDIELNGKTVEILGPNHAYQLGIGMVHQHFKLVRTFTVLENIILGIEDTKFGLITKEDARKRVLELSRKYNLNIDPDAKISEITVGMQQRVEILKILYRDAEIMIFDEPTAVLTPQEIKELIEIIKRFKKEGKSIVFISHKLDEIMSVSDRITVLRHGKNMGTFDAANTTKHKLSKQMVGRDIESPKLNTKPHLGEVALSVEHLSYTSKASGKPILNDVSFSVRKGEIVSIAGIDGNGQTELVYALTGLLQHDSGDIILNNESIGHETTRNRTLAGMAHIPEDRHKHGLVLEFPLEYNLVLQEYFTDRFQTKGFLRFDTIRQHAYDLIQDYDIRSARGPITNTRSMSGGNQQKAILAREISRSSDVLISVQPTRGLDVGAIEYVHKRLINLRNSGKAVLLVSLEIEEVMNISDRILIIYEGEITGELYPNTTSMQEIGLYMSGAKRGG